MEQSREFDSECCGKERGNMLPAECRVRRLVQDLPIKSVLMVAGAGVLLGGAFSMLRRR